MNIVWLEYPPVHMSAAFARNDVERVRLRRVMKSFGWIPADAQNDFEAAARLRDQLFEVRTALGEKPEQARGNTAAPKRPPGSAPMRRAGGKRGR